MKPKSDLLSPPPPAPCWLGFCISAKTSVTCFLLCGNSGNCPARIFGGGFVSLCRNRIESARMKRMAPEQTAHSHQRSAQCSMFGNRNRRIFRTARLEAARALRSGQSMDRRRDRSLIESERCAPTCCSQLRPRRTVRIHFAAPAPPATLEKMRATSRSRRANSISITVRRGCSTTSTRGGSSLKWRRTASLIRRRIRLRSTAPPKARPAVNPTRGCAPAGSSLDRARKNHVMDGDE